MSEWNALMRPQRQPAQQVKFGVPAVHPIGWFRRRTIRKRFNEIIQHLDKAHRCRPCMTADDHRPCYDVLCHCECSR